MPQSDLDAVLGFLGTQLGFVTPEQVVEARSAFPSAEGGRCLATSLEEMGALTPMKRALLEQMAGEAVRVWKGDAQALLDSLNGDHARARMIETGSLPSPPVTRAVSDAQRLVPPEREGQYTRLGELGRGAQSVVRRAFDEFVGREVALKELLPDQGSATPDSPATSARRARFLREARLTAQLDHPGIVAVHELAIHPDGTLVSAQKLVRGATLKARLGSCESLRRRLELLPHLVDACQAAAYAHSRGIVHRDLKPSNIMVGEFGETVLVDWGLAKKLGEPEAPETARAPQSSMDLTLAGAALGTPAYMSPEQARGDLSAIDARSDVFSLGAILYEVLTGRPPFQGATSEELLDKVRVGNFTPVRALTSEAPPELAAIAERALRREPSERYPDAEALARELSTFLAGGRVHAYRYGAWELVRKFASGHPALTTGLAVALVALLSSGVVVAIRLQATRRDLARSFVERAYTAEREADWSQAAAYFAAARVQHDTLEARWGLALARESATERILALQGPAGSFTDVAVLPDGRLVALGLGPNGTEVREVESGKTLWTYASEPVLAAALLPGGQVRLLLRGGWAFHDAATGARLGFFDRNTVGQPCPGPYPTPAVVLRGQLLSRPENGPSHVLATNVSSAERCVASEDGRQVAYQDTSEVVHLLAVDDGRELASRPGFDLRHMLFSRHGLVLIKEKRLEVFGGPDGDFIIELPEGGFRGARNDVGGQAVSGDGHLVAVARRSSNRTDVVDLRARSIQGTFSHAPRVPRFAFSLDGRRVFVAGLQNGASLSGWRLPPEAPTIHAGTWHDRPTFSSGGSRLLVYDSAEPPHYELYGVGGELLARGADSVDEAETGFAGDGPVVAFRDAVREETVVRHLEQGRVLWRSPCGLCRDLGISADASRLVRFGVLQGLEVWDTHANRLLFKEVERVGRFETRCALSPDGRRVAWTQGGTAIVRDLESARERTFPLDGEPRSLRFSPDSAYLVSVTTGSIALWETTAMRVLWSVPNAVPDQARWSADGRVLLIGSETLGTELLDARTGERLARFLDARDSGSPAVVYISPDLRAKLVMTHTHWESRPLPQPATEAPALSLAQTLEKTGLTFQGVELVAAP